MLDVPKYFANLEIYLATEDQTGTCLFIGLLQICLCLQLYVRVYSSFLNEQTNHLTTK